MNQQETLSGALQQAIFQELRNKGYELIDMLEVPKTSDHSIIVRSIQDAIQDFDKASEDAESLNYLIHVRKKPEKISHTPAGMAPVDGLYDPDGRLNIEYLDSHARLLLQVNEGHLAKKIYKAMIKNGDGLWTAHLGLGICAETAGALDEAIFHYEESNTFRPQIETYQRLSKLLIQKERHQYAAELLERALHLEDLTESHRLELLKAAGNCWLRINDHARAELNYKNALKVDPRADEVQSNLGTLYLHSGRISEARKAFQDAVSANPSNDKAFVGLGCSLLADKKPRMAHDCFVRALGSNLQNPTAIFYLVRCAYEIKQYDEAERYLSEFVKVSAVNANLLYSLAGLQYHLGKFRESYETSEKILQMRSDHEGAKDLREMARERISR